MHKCLTGKCAHSCVLACAYAHTREFVNTHMRVAFELLVSGHAWTDKLLVSGTAYELNLFVVMVYICCYVRTVLVNEVCKVLSLAANLKYLTLFQRLKKSQYLAFSASCTILHVLYYA